MKKYTAEFIGTFALVFCGTAAIIVNEQMNGAVSHSGIAIVFGAIVTVMILAFGDISGAHFNPAVTIGFVFLNKLGKGKMFYYILSQLSGAIFASMILRVLFPGNKLLGTTVPSGSPVQSFVLEFLLTFFLMLVIIKVSTGSKEKGMLAAFAVGFTVLLEAMFAGPVSGASMNPARSLAPALISGHLKYLWVYIFAPLSGALFALPVCKFTSLSNQ
ncbi:MAG TPA: aquaporin [Puia sp.]|nr:aquaporin [Puia sp.]